LHATASVSAALLDIDDLKRKPRHKSGVAKLVRPTSPTAAQTGKRKRKGETMSMLLDVSSRPWVEEDEIEY
jgi:hypothetical protein